MKKILDKAVGRGKRTQQYADEVLARITPTADAADAALNLMLPRILPHVL